MSCDTRLAKAFEEALRLPLTYQSKYVIFSDCHRGTGTAGDNFLKNEFLFLAALKYYFPKNFTYIELGDGDELWENRSMEAIKDMHPESFRMLSDYFQAKRFYSVYGNHDIMKRKERLANKYFQNFYCCYSMCCKPLFPAIYFYPGIILEDQENKKDIYLTHGHQSDLLNSTLWPLSRFLVRYVWKPLESLGIPDPTSAAKNNTRKKKSEEHLTAWAKQNHHLLITGHTHHPMIGTKESPYFNTGSCISPGGITCIEIENRCLTLIKWELSTRNDQTAYVKHEILGRKICIDEY